MNWIKSSEKLPPPSNAMNVIKVLCWFRNAPILGWYNPITGWRIDGSPSEWDIEWWCEITPPTIAQQPLSGSAETASPKSAEPTSDNGKRYTQFKNIFLMENKE